jgi:HlyD family secretion protein
MPKGDSSVAMLVLAALLAVGVGYVVPRAFVSRGQEATVSGDAEASVPEMSTSEAAAAQARSPNRALWAASAPGKVEPAGGEVRLSAAAPGRIVEVLARAGDKVGPGDLLVRLEDDELIARVHAMQAEAAVRKRERDSTDAGGKLSQDRRTAEDNLANGERALTLAREDLDHAIAGRRARSDTGSDIERLRTQVLKAKDKVDQARLALHKALAAEGLPAPGRPDAALTAARAELSGAEAALERTRIRAPAAATVLHLTAKAGEAATPSPENTLLTVGDLTSLRVRAEFEERDMGKVRVGQSAIVRSDAFPGKDFEGKVVSLAQALAPSTIGQRGPRKPSDVDVLEVMIELSGQPPLLPGMRVDVFLKPDATAKAN